MCGISAVFSGQPRPLATFVENMNVLVKHRGPDGQGTAVFRSADESTGALELAANGSGTVALGHTRLAILELSPLGHQPMASGNDGRYWITYNGEIYNHTELREELAAIGHAFRSHSDTEVILAAYTHWGRDCLQRFNGMFAFVLLDRISGRVFIARDRFGVKPLYFWHSPEGLLAVASEIKQFTTLPGWQANLNGQRAYDFLNWGLFDHTGETLFAGVHQLRGGECVEADLETLLRGVRPNRWYNLTRAHWAGDFEEASRQFGIMLEDSVRLRLRADVAVGSCLSGGLDSSSIVCIASRILRNEAGDGAQHTFSARSTEKRYDEGDYISTVTSAANVIAHETIPPLNELFKSLPEIAWHQDEPFGSTSIFAQWHVFRLAHVHGVKVMLDGQGADELLAGYHGFFGPRLAGLLRGGRLLDLAGEIAALKKRHGYPAVFALKIMADMLLPNSLRQTLRRLAGKSSTLAGSWLNMERLGAEGLDPYVSAGARTDTVRDLSVAQLLNSHLPMLLHWEDRDSMAHSVEARVPFLDYRLVEFALGLPDEFKLQHGMTKRVLRESMQGILPELIRSRIDKLGFATPEEVWLRQQAPDEFRAAIGNAIEQSQGILRPAARDYLEDVISGQRPFSFLPWRMISFGAWMGRFQVSA